MNYNACDTCAVAITNDDFTGMDDDTANTVAATIEAVGMLCNAGDFDPPGYWNCYFCDDVQIGKGHTYESVN